MYYLADFLREHFFGLKVKVTPTDSPSEYRWEHDGRWGMIQVDNGDEVVFITEYYGPEANKLHLDNLHGDHVRIFPAPANPSFHYAENDPGSPLSRIILGCWSLKHGNRWCGPCLDCSYR